MELGTLANLILSLSQNQLTGAIPTELGSLSNLQNCTWNQLSWGDTYELGSLTNLEFWPSAGTELTGTIPTWLGSLANLEELYLWGNELTGEIPGVGQPRQPGRTIPLGTDWRDTFGVGQPRQPGRTAVSQTTS